MSDTSTRNFLQAYYQEARVSRFFTEIFQTPRENFYASEAVEIDIVRSGEEIAIAVQDLSAGYRNNEATTWTSKEFVPPVFKERVGLDSSKLLARRPGQTAYANPNYRANIAEHMMRGMRLVEDKMRRANELQAAQVLQTGTATIVDSAGASIFAIDYKPKATHFPTASTAWDAGGDIVGDLLSLADVIRNDGYADPKVTIWGEDAFEAALGNADFLARFDNRRIDLGAIGPMANGGGTESGNFRGRLDLGNFQIEIWTYGGRYQDPQTLASTQYLDPAKVVMLVPGLRLDATFGAVPHIGSELGITGAGILPGFPGRFGSSQAGIDMFTHVWLTSDGTQVFGGVGSRPLFIPTAIDRFGCIDSGV